MLLLSCPPPHLLTGLSARGVVWVGGWTVAAEHRVGLCVGGWVCVYHVADIIFGSRGRQVPGLLWSVDGGRRRLVGAGRGGCTRYNRI